ncbi:MAG: hypothetical protein FGM46_04050 [Ferruginibacter sp.]|nr:hypothetical protein [Ferruginibacter sp.]
MVTISNFMERQRKDGSSFIVLKITGGLELVQSSSTGNFYATVRKCTIPSTFSAEVAKTLVGTQISGNIVRVNVPSYEYVNKRTGEIMQLQHGYSYQPEGSMALIGQARVTDLEIEDGKSISNPYTLQGV